MAAIFYVFVRFKKRNRVTIALAQTRVAQKNVLGRHSSRCITIEVRERLEHSSACSIFPLPLI